MLVTRITCGSCGKIHRIHRNLAGGSRYRFTCRHCGAEVIFSTNCVRWAFSPRTPEAKGSESTYRTRSGFDTVAREFDTLPGCAVEPGDATAPSQPPVSPVAPVDTLVDNMGTVDTVVHHTVSATADTVADHTITENTVVDQTVPEVIVLPPTPPEATNAPSKPAIRTRDTKIDRRSPVHLTPLVRRGVSTDRESSRVRWLRAKRGRGAA
jgi:hypothetical protein